MKRFYPLLAFFGIIVLLVGWSYWNFKRQPSPDKLFQISVEGMESIVSKSSDTVAMRMLAWCKSGKLKFVESSNNDSIFNLRNKGDTLYVILNLGDLGFAGLLPYLNNSKFGYRNGLIMVHGRTYSRFNKEYFGLVLLMNLYLHLTKPIADNWFEEAKIKIEAVEFAGKMMAAWGGEPYREWFERELNAVKKDGIIKEMPKAAQTELYQIFKPDVYDELYFLTDIAWMNCLFKIYEDSPTALFEKIRLMQEFGYLKAM